MTATIAETLERALGSTLEIVRAFPNDKLDFWPAPNMMTVTEQIEHLAHNLEYVVEPVAALYDHSSEASQSSDPVPRLERAVTRVNAVMAAVPEDDWLREVGFPGDFKMNILQAALVTLEHDAHHRGQLIVALRILDIDPPKRWQSS
jgi:uncharacterized damage-inducible protein DinB